LQAPSGRQRVIYLAQLCKLLKGQRKKPDFNQAGPRRLRDLKLLEKFK